MQYYQHHIGDYRKDTAHLSLLEHGIYRQLLDQYYLDESPLVADDAKLMRLMCVRSDDEKEAFKNVISDFFCAENGFYVHVRCDNELAEIYEKSEKARTSAKMRWNVKDSERNANASEPQCERNANGMLPNNPITHNPITHNPITQLPIDPEPIEKPEGDSKKVAVGKKGSRLPSDWLLLKAWGDWAMQQGLTVEAVKLEAEKFRDYWIAQGGQKGVKLDWFATWRNWIRNASTARSPIGSPRPSTVRSSLQDTFNNMQAVLEARR